MVAARGLWIVDEDERLVVCTNTPDGPTPPTNTVVVVAGEHEGARITGYHWPEPRMRQWGFAGSPKRTATPSWRGRVTRRFRDVHVLRPPFAANYLRKGEDGTVHGSRERLEQGHRRHLLTPPALRSAGLTAILLSDC